MAIRTRTSAVWVTLPPIKHAIRLTAARAAESGPNGSARDRAPLPADPARRAPERDNASARRMGVRAPVCLRRLVPAAPPSALLLHPNVAVLSSARWTTERIATTVAQEMINHLRKSPAVHERVRLTGRSGVIGPTRVSLLEEGRGRENAVGRTKGANAREKIPKANCVVVRRAVSGVNGAAGPAIFAIAARARLYR